MNQRLDLLGIMYRESSEADTDTDAYRPRVRRNGACLAILGIDL
jgi:hypothetical protein